MAAKRRRMRNSPRAVTRAWVGQPGHGAILRAYRVRYLRTLVAKSYHALATIRHYHIAWPDAATATVDPALHERSELRTIGEQTIRAACLIGHIEIDREVMRPTVHQFVLKTGQRIPLPSAAVIIVGQPSPAQPSAAFKLAAKILADE